VGRKALVREVSSDVEVDDIFDDATGDQAVEEDIETVRLTDISEIVAKYSVVDRFFDERDEDDGEPVETDQFVEEIEPEESPADLAASLRSNPLFRSRRNAGVHADWDSMQDNDADATAASSDKTVAEEAAAAEETIVDAASDTDAGAEPSYIEDLESAEVNAPQDVTAAPAEAGAETANPDTAEGKEQLSELTKAMRFSPILRRRRDDDLHSNWSDNASNAIQEIGNTRLIYQQYSGAPMHEAAEPPQQNVVRRHRRTLVHTAALCTALPVVAGITFALTLYAQKNVRPAELWSWASAAMIGEEIEQTAAATSDEASSASLLPATPNGTPTVAPTEQVAAVSPETLTAPGLPGPAAVPEQSAPAAADAEGSPATQIFMARLTVADAEGFSTEPIPLSLDVTRGLSDQRVRVRISGLPEGASLSAGVDFGNGEWGLQETDLEGLTMSLPAGFSGEVTLIAMVIDDATHIQAGETTTLQVHVSPDRPTVVEPASARPVEAAPSFAPPDGPVPQSPARTETVVPQRSLFPELNMLAPDAVPQGETDVALASPATDVPVDATPAEAIATQQVNQLITRGDQLMDLGDISSARLFYERAAQDGDPRAQTALGKSYDPLIFGSLQVRGTPADPQLARIWYLRGVQGGSQEAMTRLQALEAWLNR
jgi:hypothetical protein